MCVQGSSECSSQAPPSEAYEFIDLSHSGGGAVN